MTGAAIKTAAKIKTRHGAVAQINAGWRAILAPDAAVSPLVRRGASPASVGRATGGRMGFVCAPYLADVQVGGEWRPERSVRLSILAARELRRLQMEGVSAICPAVLQAAMCEASGLIPDAPPCLHRPSWDIWVRPFLAQAAFLVVPDIPGWQNCPDVLAQVMGALARNVAVHVYAGGAV